MALTRAEPGCFRFEVEPTEDPLVWTVVEQFVDRAAFDAHQARVRTSRWLEATAGIARDYVISTRDSLDEVSAVPPRQCCAGFAPPTPRRCTPRSPRPTTWPARVMWPRRRMPSATSRTCLQTTRLTSPGRSPRGTS
ncbi:antibiotic biosynthesis monooxygenase [Brachybacterium muris]|nr:antibiotic biosynthesis monooxygenase [Brachybacterium muris]MCT2261318.1 antibiotic biosynthesis monooxygenase [Brachybacterium muris]